MRRLEQGELAALDRFANRSALTFLALSLLLVALALALRRLEVHGVRRHATSLALLGACFLAFIGQTYAWDARPPVDVTNGWGADGEVQPIGGATWKIEGFYEVCKSRGLDGTQGVMLPASTER